MPDRWLCVHCSKPLTVTAGMKFRKHTNGAETCMGSGERVPAHQAVKGPIGLGVDPGTPEEGRDMGRCPVCQQMRRIGPTGHIVAHQQRGYPVECNGSGMLYQPPEETPCPATAPSFTPTPNVPSAPSWPEPPLTPGLDGPPTWATSANTSTTKIVSPASPFRQPAPPAEAAPFPAATTAPATTTDGCDFPPTNGIEPATVTFAQPNGKTPPQPMTTLGEQICAGLKQMFYHYQQRKTDDNRSAQTHLGPSDIGSPCDRQLAMSLLRIPPVNPGGDGWAAFVGTSVHAGLAEMLQWADAGTGRYVAELPLVFPNAHVPRGTGDMLDRTLCFFGDHKAMGQWSLRKLRDKGPSPKYRVQIHTYAYGARLKGEKVEHVAIIAWPRDQSTLDDLYVWTEPYDASIALKALARVDDIAAENDRERIRLGAEVTDMLIARRFPITPDCTFCPFHAPGDNNFERGCNGRS